MTVRRLLIAWLGLSLLCWGLTSSANLLQMPFTVATSGAPVNTVAPQLTPAGTVVSGTALSCSQGTWTGAPTITYAYAMFRDGTTNVGSTNAYTTVTADQGHSITCTVTATNGVGSTPATTNAVAVVAPHSVWSPTDKNASIALTATTITNDTATQTTTASSFLMGRGTQAYTVTSSNKKVLTYTILTADTGGGWIGGFSDSAASVSVSNYPGKAAHGLGLQASTAYGTGLFTYQDGTQVTPADVCVPTTSVFKQGDTMWLAVDFNNGWAFCSKDCHTWLGGYNPDQSGTAGAPIVLTNATYYPAWSGGNFPSGGDAAVINTAPNLTGCTGLSGFSGWQ